MKFLLNLAFLDANTSPYSFFIVVLWGPFLVWLLSKSSSPKSTEKVDFFLSFCIRFWFLSTFFLLLAWLYLFTEGGVNLIKIVTYATEHFPFCFVIGSLVFLGVISKSKELKLLYFLLCYEFLVCISCSTNPFLVHCLVVFLILFFDKLIIKARNNLEIWGFTFFFTALFWLLLLNTLQLGGSHLDLDSLSFEPNLIKTLVFLFSLWYLSTGYYYSSQNFVVRFSYLNYLLFGGILLFFRVEGLYSSDTWVILGVFAGIFWFLACVLHGNTRGLLDYIARNILEIPHSEFSLTSVSKAYLFFWEKIAPLHNQRYSELTTRWEKWLFTNLVVYTILTSVFIVVVSALSSNYLFLFILYNFLVNSGLLHLKFLFFGLLSFLLSVGCHDKVWSSTLQSQLGPNVLHLLGYNNQTGSVVSKMATLIKTGALEATSKVGETQMMQKVSKFGSTIGENAVNITKSSNFQKIDAIENIGGKLVKVGTGIGLVAGAYDYHSDIVKEKVLLEAKLKMAELKAEVAETQLTDLRNQILEEKLKRAEVSAKLIEKQNLELKAKLSVISSKPLLLKAAEAEDPVQKSRELESIKKKIEAKNYLKFPSKKE